MVEHIRSPLITAAAVTDGAPNARAPLAFAGALTGGNPKVREPFLTALGVTGGNPKVRASFAYGGAVTGGIPAIRCPLIIVQAVVDIPEVFVATEVFPTLQGRAWGFKKNPEFDTAIRPSVSGRETRNAFRQYPIWQFEMVYEFLRDDNIANGYTYSDLRTLQGFFLQMQGAFGAFLFHDRDDYHVAQGVIATGDAVTSIFPFVRNFGGFSEPVGQIDLSPIGSFASTAVNTSNGDITLGGHGLTTAQGPLFISNAGGSLPTGLSAVTPYWPIVVDPNTLQLASTHANAIAATPIIPSAQGSGTDTLAKGWAVALAIAETDSVPATGPYTVAVAHAATFLADNGVTISGTPLTKVSGSPAAGQYSESAGTYTFNVAQASASAVIAYKYRSTDVTLNLPNQMVFSAIPVAGAVITADFDFYFVCRFSDDTTDADQFVSKLWELKKLDFQSIIQ